MQRLNDRITLSPSDVTGFLACEHLTTLELAVARGRLASAAGYSCPACGAGCDDLTFEHAGECPVCGMVLLPRFESKDGR